VLSLHQLFIVLAASAVITIAPGPDNLAILSLGMARGRNSGMTFGFGCALGCLNHTVLAALGVSALIAASPAAFTGLKFAGGAYLIWLGVQALRPARPIAKLDAGSDPQESARRLFIKGLLANAINPKVILFFLAFLPQFTDSARGHIGWQMLGLGLVFTLQAIAIFGAIGWFAGAIGERLSQVPGAAAWLDRVAGCIFIALGMRLIA
jgi:threonine/homoserine/homoserine lactone efflux protein